MWTWTAVLFDILHGTLHEKYTPKLSQAPSSAIYVSPIVTLSMLSCHLGVAC